MFPFSWKGLQLLFSPLLPVIPVQCTDCCRQEPWEQSHGTSLNAQPSTLSSCWLMSSQVLPKTFTLWPKFMNLQLSFSWMSAKTVHGCCSMKHGTIFNFDFGVLRIEFLMHFWSPNSLPSCRSRSFMVLIQKEPVLSQYLSFFEY